MSAGAIAEGVLVALPEVIEAIKYAAKELGYDDAAIIRLAAEKLPALMPTPADELTDYEAARAEVLGRKP